MIYFQPAAKQAPLGQSMARQYTMAMVEKGILS
jgi:hypothetical protein